MAILFENNASSTLASGITAAATSLTVASTTGDLFPIVNGADPDEYCILALEDASGNIEVIHCTARTAASDTLTIVRGQESTTAQAFVSGDRVELRATKGTMEALIQRTNDVIDGGTF